MKNILKIFGIMTLLFSLSVPTAFAGAFTAYSQDVTAYTGSTYKSNGSSRLTHSGKTPGLGYVAVRKNTITNQPHVAFVLPV